MVGAGQLCWLSDNSGLEVIKPVLDSDIVYIKLSDCSVPFNDEMMHMATDQGLTVL